MNREDEEVNEDDTKKLSICYDGIEYQDRWINQKEWDTLHDLIEGLLCCDEAELSRIKAALQIDFPMEFGKP